MWVVANPPTGLDHGTGEESCLKVAASTSANPESDLF